MQKFSCQENIECLLYEQCVNKIKKIKNCKNDWRVRNEKTECMEVV